jgi:gamma-glutamyltranspeptidase
MHGVIAAGSAPTAEAGAEILARGGNAVDAAVAACFATSAGEPTLTSLAGGGVMIHRDAKSGEVTICDFFSDAPRRLPQDVKNLDFRGVDIDFGPAKQQFHIGAGAAGVPGVVPGLCTALERWGSLPLSDVVAPACRFLREGVVLGPFQVRAAKLLEAMKKAPLHKRGARFECHLALLGPNQEVGKFVGQCWGKILEAEVGTEGFGYDSLFVPANEDRTFGELSAAKKDSISHRAKAFQLMAAWMRENGIA